MTAIEKYRTQIDSNGSKWAGEKPDSIDKLIEALRKYTIGETFFTSFELGENGSERGLINHCPIYTNKNETTFFGNFLEYSHVFRIHTNDPEVIKQLTEAIQANEGWKLYYSKHLVSKPKAPSRGYELQRWKQMDQYRATAFSYLDREEGTEYVTNSNGHAYNYMEIKSQMIDRIV